jgi:predicted TIM-barrel fold metal-dependent hydrolase
MKIDCHVHLFALSPTSGGKLRMSALHSLMMPLVARRLGLEFRGDPEEQEHEYVRTLRNYVESSELDKAVLLAFDRVYLKNGEVDSRSTRFHVPNNFVREICSMHPDCFLMGASVHPYRKDALEALTRVVEQGAALIKLLPNSHGFDPADPDLLSYYRRVSDLKVPLLVHCGYEHTIPTLDQSFGEPARWRPALDQGAVVIVAHAGSAGKLHFHETMGAFLRLTATYPNCFGDTAALANSWRSKYLFELLDPERIERKYQVQLDDPFARLIHGSDYPIPVSPRALRRRMSKESYHRIQGLSNPLQLDLELKRQVGVPDSILTNAHDKIGNGKYST